MSARTILFAELRVWVPGRNQAVPTFEGKKWIRSVMWIRIRIQGCKMKEKAVLNQQIFVFFFRRKLYISNLNLKKGEGLKFFFS